MNVDPRDIPPFPVHLLAGLPQLAELTIGGTPSNAGMLALAQHCPNLETLEWWWCSGSVYGTQAVGWPIDLTILSGLKNGCVNLRDLKQLHSDDHFYSDALVSCETNTLPVFGVFVPSNEPSPFAKSPWQATAQDFAILPHQTASAAFRWNCCVVGSRLRD